MDEPILRNMLEAGVHFGHQTNRWNPKMERFIFGEKNGIYIIDLEKTLECLNKAKEFLKGVAAAGEVILFVGTKKQAQNIIKEEATRCGMPYVNDRWLGGTLTNFQTIKKSIKRLKELERLQGSEEFPNLIKKEQAHISKEIQRLKKNLEGISQMVKPPAAIFLIDSNKEDTAVKEANKLLIPVASLIDTNADPDLISYPIPGNDDAIKSIKLITSLVVESILEGRKEFVGQRTIEVEEALKKEIEMAVQTPVEIEELDVTDVVDKKEIKKKPPLRKRPLRIKTGA